MNHGFALRPYQVAALDELAAAWRDLDREGKAPRLLLVSRTGTGKTVISAEFLRRVIAKGRRAAFVVRDRTLLDQTSRHLDAIGVTQHGVIAAGHSRRAPLFPLQVCSAQTLVSRGEAPDADVLVFDEAHSILCRTSRAIVEAYPAATILGLTATPERGDGLPMGDVFERLVQVRQTYRQLVDAGALVPVTVLGPKSGKPEKELAEDPLVALERHAPRLSGHKPVIFVQSRAAAAELAARARLVGYRAAAVDGETDSAELADAFARFVLPASDPRALDVLVNCNLLTQGWDCPPADVGILARGCTTWGAYMQICGRFLRPSPASGKSSALIVDLRGAVYKHGLPSDDRTFSLARSETQREKELAPDPVTSCRACGCAFRAGVDRACPRCGAIAPGRPAPKVKRQELGEAGREIRVASAAEKWAFFEATVREQRARGYKPAWVGVRFLQRFGFWPHYKHSQVKETA